MWFQSVFPLIPFISSYCLIWISLTWDIVHILTAAPAKRSHCSLLWTWGSSSPLLLHNADNQDGVVTHTPLEPDILDCGVKWALGSICMNKASGSDGIPVELFQILKDDAVKVLHSICQQIGKPGSDHRTGKGKFSFQPQRKAMPNMFKLLHNCTHLTL